MGLYTIVLLAGTTVEILPSALSQVIYPRTVEHYGRTESLRASMKIAIKPMFAIAAGMALLAVVAQPLIYPVISWLLPQYVDAVPAIRWSLVVAVLSSFSPLAYGFILAKRQWLYTAAMVSGVLAYLAAIGAFALQGLTLVSFPQAMIVGKIAQIAATCVLLLYLIRQRRRHAHD